MTDMNHLRVLEAKIDKLSPEAQLLMASQLVKVDPKVAATIAQKAINQIMLAELLTPHP